MTVRKNNLTLFIFLLIIGCTNGQDSLKDLNDSWVKLKTQLQRRNDMALTVIADINRPDSADQSSIGKIKAGVADFKRFIDSTTNLDSLTVRLTNQKAKESIRLISSAVNLRMDQPGFNADKFKDLQMQLMIAENGISNAKHNFNELCLRYKRMDLLYDKR